MKIIDEEQSVFELFSIYKKISKNCTVFATSDSNEEPHWNMVYPSKYNYIYQDDELEKCLDFYKSYGLDGHVLTFEDKWEKYSIQTEEYFYIDEELIQSQTSLDVKEFSLISDNDLEIFCKIFQKAFNLNEKTNDFFKAKMEVFANRKGSKFWVVSYMGIACGTASAFKTKNNANFMFNGAVLPEFQGKNIGTQMINYCIRKVEKPIYTYSYNNGMRKKILPQAGFKSAGNIYIIPIHIYKEKIKSI